MEGRTFPECVKTFKEPDPSVLKSCSEALNISRYLEMCNN